MKYIKFLIFGVIFGIALAKAEVVSWYRIYEMFMFKSFHMYGIIGSAVVIGIVLVYFAKRYKWKAFNGLPMSFPPKEKGIPKYLIGGIIFGLGWALAGACPGPMYILLGGGYWMILLVIVSALLGTFVYGLLRDKLPH